MITRQRIFRVEGGPLAQAIKDTDAERQRIAGMYILFGEVLGCTQVHTWPWTGRFAGCTFAKGKEPSLTGWRKSHKMWVPRKGSPVGETVLEAIRKMPPIPAMQTILEQFGLTVHKEQVSGGGPSYVEGFVDKGIHYVHVPWVDYDAEHIELVRLIDGDISEAMKFVTTWQVPIDWVEVQPFQKLLEWTELDRA